MKLIVGILVGFVGTVALTLAAGTVATVEIMNCMTEMISIIISLF